ncbi:MAG: hypothetical protein HXY20_10315 [Acidobacteria bacterium]|nr:hypothetical protein [Acidobacteriota bacterium]
MREYSQNFRNLQKKAPLQPLRLMTVAAMIVQKKAFAEVTALCCENLKPVLAGGPNPISMRGQIEGVIRKVIR